MGNEKKNTYPDEFAIVDGKRERRTVEDGVIISFDLPTIYDMNGDIDADKTTAYRKSVADAASAVSGLCATVGTTPWRLLGCAMRESSVYGEYAALLDSFDSAMLDYDFDKAHNALEKITDMSDSGIPSYISCSTRYDLEKTFADDDDEADADVTHDVKPIKMDDTGADFDEAAKDTANIIDTIVRNYKTDGVKMSNGATSTLGFVETIVSDILGSYPIGKSEDGNYDNVKTLREALRPAYNAMLESNNAYIEAEGGNDDSIAAADRKCIEALNEYAEQLREYGMESSPDYDSIMTEISIMSVIE